MAEPETTPILVIDGHQATITLNRPGKLNKLTSADLATLYEQFQHVDATPEVRVLVLTGAGRAFSAGYDLDAIGAAASGPTFEAVCDRLERLAAPSICALNGGVYGGATDLALACDFRIGVDSAEMLMPAARLGIQYYPSGMVRFVSRLGLAAAKRLFLTAQKIDAAQMLRLGFLDEAAPAAEWNERVAALAGLIASNAPLAVQGMKRSLNEIARGGLDETAASRRHAESLKGEELREGAAAFRERRPPRF